MYASILLKYPHYFLTNDHLGHGKRKPVFGGFANNKGADQPKHPRSLINAFAISASGSIISNK